MRNKKIQRVPFTSTKPHYRLGLMLAVLLISTAIFAISLSILTEGSLKPKVTYAQTSSSIFGIEANPLSPEGGADRIAQTQTAWVRGPVVFWNNIELSEGSYTWANLSEVVAELQLADANGYEPIVVVTGTPSWAQKYNGYTCGPIDATKFNAFGNFMAALINHLKQANLSVKYWELWNEPDASWQDVPSPTYIWFGCWGEKGDTNYYGGGYYGDMLKTVYPKIKTADPQSQVLVGGLLMDCDPVNPPDDPTKPGSKKDCTSSKFLEGILVNGGPSSFDGISYHAYDYYGGPGVYNNPNWNAAWDQDGPSLIPKSHYIRNLLNKYNAPNKYLLNTENALLCATCSNDTDFENTKAYYLTESYASAIAQGLKANIWFSLRGEWGRNNGLLDLTKAGDPPLPAFYAYQFAAQELAGVGYVGRVSGLAGVRGYEFSKGNRHIWLIWSMDGTNTQVNLPATPLAVYDVDGDQLTNPSQLLTVGREPYYVELPAFLPRLHLVRTDKVRYQMIGDFEAGQDGWTFINNGLPASIVASSPGDPSIPAGANSVLLGSPSYPCLSVPIGDAEIRKAISVPALTNGKVLLYFDYIIYSQDWFNLTQYDRFEVTNLNAPTTPFLDGNLINLNLTACNYRRIPGSENPRDGKTTGWAVGSLDLSSYQGQTITLSFRNVTHPDSYYNTYTYLDNIRLFEMPVPR